MIVENQYASDVALELWSGRQLEYTPQEGKVTGRNLASAAFIAAEPHARVTVDAPSDAVRNYLTILGLKDGYRHTYLNHATLEVGANTLIRIGPDATLSAYQSCSCTEGVSEQEIDETVAAADALADLAVLLAGEAGVLRALLTPLDELTASIIKAILDGEPLQLPQLSLGDWDFDAGVYRRTRQVDEAQMIMEGRLLWGDWEDGSENAPEPGTIVPGHLDVAADYFTDLLVNVNADGEVVFTFTTAGPLAPLLGVPSGTASPYRLKLTDWLTRVLNQLTSMRWQGDVKLSHLGDDLYLPEFRLAHVGRPGYRWELDLLAQEVTIEQTPLRLTIEADETSTAAALDPTGNWNPRGQELVLREWLLEVDGEGNGSGRVEFEARGDALFDYTGSLQYDSTSVSAPTAFLNCTVDGSPIQRP